MDKLTIYIDGGSRGNPGPSALGCVIIDKKNKRKEYAEFLGEGTNNEAEYQALIFALKKVKSLLGKEKIKKILLEVRSDSELLVKQMKGQYKIKEEGIQKLFLEAWNLKIDFYRVDFILIPRAENKTADQLVNQALDSEASKQKLF